jgi:fructose-1,6-bisphosphatase/inositol monophosphatase family enzyme
LRGKLRSTDVAAGLLILKEAGGIYSINGKVNNELKLSKETKLTLVAASSVGTLEEILIKLGQ